MACEERRSRRDCSAQDSRWRLRGRTRRALAEASLCLGVGVLSAGVASAGVASTGIASAGIASAGAIQQRPPAPRQQPPPMMNKALIGRTPAEIVKILTSATGSGVAANMPVQAAISDAVYGTVEKLSAQLKSRVFFIMLASKTHIDTYGALYDVLGLAGDDVLIVSTITRWRIKCAHIPAEKLMLLERQAMALTMLPAAQRFSVVTATLGVLMASGADLPHSKQTGAVEKRGIPSSGLPLFAGGLSLGALLALAGVWVGRRSTTTRS